MMISIKQDKNRTERENKTFDRSKVNMRSVRSDIFDSRPFCKQKRIEMTRGRNEI